MFHAARNANRIVRTQNEGRAPSLQFRIGKYRLNAILAHDPIASFRDD